MPGRVILVLEGRSFRTSYPPLLQVLERSSGIRILRGAWVFENSSPASVNALIAGYVPSLDGVFITEIVEPFVARNLRAPLEPSP